MPWLRIACLVSVLAFCSSAEASTFVISYENRPAVDPAVSFEVDCLGASEASDCPTRAAALEAELVELLGELEGLSDADTVALFTAAVTSDSPEVQELGLRYFSRSRTLPTSLWSSVKQFFFGPEPGIGQPSAEILAFSTEMVNQQTSALYLAQRPGDHYGASIPAESGANDPSASALAEDVVLDAVPAFTDQERFSPAKRLLMINRFLRDAQGSTSEIPVTGFVTDAAKSEVQAHFTTLFGKEPYPPLATSQAQLQTLNAELVGLQQRLTTGDQQAVTRLQDVIMELTKAQEALTVGSVLGIDSTECPDHVFWFEGSGQDAYSKPLSRAVIVGTDPLLGRTAIRYVSGSYSSTSQPSGSVPDGGVVQSATGGSEHVADAGVVGAEPAVKPDGGCAAHAPEGSAAELWLLVPLGLWLRRKRSRSV